MIIKPIIKVCSLLLWVILVSNCDKKISEVIVAEEVVEEIEQEPIGEYTDRNDIPPPPSEPWWTIDPDQMTYCQRALWSSLKHFYPIQDSLNPEYQLYTINNQPESQYVFTQVLGPFIEKINDSFTENYLFNPEYSCPEELEADFFEGALGEPSCIAHNNVDNVVTYLYYTKLRYRYGPCPFTRYDGEDIGVHCGSYQTQYCAKLRAIFSMETSELVYIDFMRF